MQIQESDSQQPSQPEPDPSQEVAPSDQEQAAPESPEDEGEQEAGGEEPEAVGDEEEKTPAETPEAKHKRKSGFRRTIDRLERQNQILLEQLQRGVAQPPVAAPPPKEKTPEQLQADQAKEFIRTIIHSEFAEQQRVQKQASAQAEFQKRRAEALEKYPDFDEVLDSADAPVSDAVKQAVLTSKRGHDIMYQLAKNPAELARISALPPLEAALEIGALGAKASGANQPTPKPAVRPPAPPSRVGGSASSTRSLETLPLAEYKRAMASRRR